MPLGPPAGVAAAIGRGGAERATASAFCRGGCGYFAEDSRGYCLHCLRGDRDAGGAEEAAEEAGGSRYREGSRQACGGGQGSDEGSAVVAWERLSSDHSSVVAQQHGQRRGRRRSSSQAEHGVAEVDDSTRRVAEAFRLACRGGCGRLVGPEEDGRRCAVCRLTQQRGGGGGVEASMEMSPTRAPGGGGVVDITRRGRQQRGSQGQLGSRWSGSGSEQHSPSAASRREGSCSGAIENPRLLASRDQHRSSQEEADDLSCAHRRGGKVRSTFGFSGFDDGFASTGQLGDEASRRVLQEDLERSEHLAAKGLAALVRPWA